MKTDEQKALEEIQEAKARITTAETLLNKIKSAKKCGTIFDRIQTVEAAFEEEGLNMDDILPYKNPTTRKEKYRNACEVVEVVMKALNEDWEADYTNYSQYKYRPCVKLKKDSSKRSGFGFAYSSYGCHGSADAGSRLVLESSDKVMHFLKYFEQEWCEYLTL